jgi:tetratricopeptide (TPR) repeat protein
MSNVAKLKKQAAELELKKQFDKALAIYIKLLESFDENASELDVALFNRVGDLMLRQGNVADAVDYYEQAIDRYADTGFFNNAIALCNKVLRHSPGRATVYYKLGKISAQKGFKNDAKVNFLEYADRMQKSGKVDEAFRALKEFADLCPDQDDIRLTLADQLTKADRKGEAIEQLQTLHEKYESEGRSSEASATAQRMRAIDPSVEPKSSGGGRRKSTSGDLVFLDLDTPSPRATIPSPPPVPPARSITPPPLTPPAPSTPIQTPPHLRPSFSEKPTVITNAIEAGPNPSLVEDPMPDITRVGDDSLGILKSTPSASLLGLESTSLADDDDEVPPTPPSGSLLDLEPTSYETEEPTRVDRSATPTHAMRDHSVTPGGDLELIMPEPIEPTPSHGSAALDFDLADLTPPPSTTPPASRPTPGVSRVALEGLPLMDLEVPPPTPTSSARIPTPADTLSLSSDLELIDAATLDDAVDTGAVGGADLGSVGDIGDDLLDEDWPQTTESEIPEMLTLDDGDAIALPTPSSARRSTLVAVHSVEILKASVEGEPDNWSLHRELAEAMLEAGDREGGVRELELAMTGAERSGDLDLASSIAEEIGRLEPDSVKHHQKRVEYAFRTNDRGRLVEAYVSLADALLRAEQVDKARTVYQRVIDLAPDDMRARAALDSMPGAQPPEPPAPPPPAPGKRGSAAVTPAIPAEPATPAARASATFVNLGDWLRDSEGPKDTRMVVDEQEPTGDEDADFADMLRKFKQGVAENVDAEDYQSHYDLAIAFKEMGLLDEAIAEFQKALGSPTNRLPTFEALGQCFLEKNQPKLATSILTRALTEKASEDQLIGVLYLLGRAAETQGNATDAVTYYQRVFVLDIQFRDTADRLNELEKATR